jgi:hypothetical protein
MVIKSTWRREQCEDEDENIITTENNPCAKKWSDGCRLNNVINQLNDFHSYLFQPAHT